jgi:CRP/FNR family transcriptional regulator
LRWAINSANNIYYFEALSDVEVYSAPKIEFNEYLRKKPEMLLTVTNQALFDYGVLIYRMQHIVFGNAYAKVASIILTAAKQFGQKEGAGATVPIRLTHQQIALSAGITRETASIEIKKMEKRGVISYNGRMMQVNDLQKLEEDAFL